jgi:outer membrane receptor protein involved in Fe transport
MYLRIKPPISWVLGFALVVNPAICVTAMAATAGIEEIVVTARKREESVQTVPLSISALSGQQLQELGAGNDYDVANFTVNFNTVQQIGRDLDRPVIRGQAAPSVGGEPNASYFIDGVFVTSSISTATLDVVDRVEVLRGPQSAQLGRGTFSGAVNYITKKPSDEFEGTVNARIGSHNDYKIGAWASGPVWEGKLSYLVSGNFDSYGGQWRNTLKANEAAFEPYFLAGPLGGTPGALGGKPGDPGCTPGTVCFTYGKIFDRAPQQADNSRLGDEQTTDFLGKLLARPFDGTDITLKYSYTRGDDGAYPSLASLKQNCYLPTPGTAAYVRQIDGTSQGAGMFCGKLTTTGLVNKINIPDFLYGVPASDKNTGADIPSAFSFPAKPGTRRTTQRYLVDLKQDIGNFQLVARAAYNTVESEIVFDLDHTQYRVLAGLFEMDAKSRSHDDAFELRLASPQDLSVRGQLGVYYFDFRSREVQRALPGPGIPIGINTGGTPSADFPATPLRRSTENEAVFGSFEWDFIERWTLALEARYGKDSKKLVSATVDPDSLAPFTGSVQTKAFTPRITIQFKPTDDMMLYALAAKGNKPADFNDGYFRSNNDPSATQKALLAKSVEDPASKFHGRACNEPIAVVCEETAWTYEGGIKTKWLDGRFTANLAAFFIDWQNLAVYQIDSVAGTAGVTNSFSVQVNLGSARSYGVEYESNYLVNDFLSLRASYGYTNARFINAVDGDVARIVGPTAGDPNGDGIVSGNRVPNSPEHTIVLGANVTRPLKEGRSVFFRLDDSFQTKRYSQAGNFNWIGNRNLVNLHFGLKADKWTATAYVKNLLNDITQQANLNFVDFAHPYSRVLDNGSTAYAPATFYSLNPTRGRDIGLQLQYRF